jgi:hypothetical protein
VRLKRIAADVKAQIVRGDGIVSGMNRFAHSVDATSGQLDLFEVLELLTALARRLAAMRGVSLRIARAEAAATVTSAPFLLLNLLWLCLEHAMSAAGPDRTVELTAEKSGRGACIRFRNLAGLKDALADDFPAGPAASLCEALNAEVRAEAPANEMVVRLSDLAE